MGCILILLLPPTAAILFLSRSMGPDVMGLALPILFGWFIVVFIGWKIRYRSPKGTANSSRYAGSKLRSRSGNCSICGADENEQHRGH